MVTTAKITKLFIFPLFLTNLVEARRISIQGDIVELINGNVAGNFKTLVALLTELKLVDELKGMTNQTIFAPSDEAFEKLGGLQSLDHLKHIGELKATVLRHVLDGITVPAIAVATGPVNTLGYGNTGCGVFKWWVQN